MMSNIRWIAPVAALAALGACSFTYESGPTSGETRQFSDFDRVVASAGVNVVVKQGPFAVSVRGPEGKLKDLRIEQNGRTLKVYRDSMNSWFGWSRGRMEATLTAPTFVGLSASSGADIEGENLSLEAIELEANSGGDVEITGTCKSADAQASSGGDVNAEDLKCEDVTAQASSGGDVDVFASVSADGQASSGGDVRFHGKPAKVTQQKSSGGDVDVE